MKNLIVILSLLFVTTTFAQDYTGSSCYQQFQKRAQELRDEVKEKQESDGFGKKVAGFFCSLDKAAQVLMEEPGYGRADLTSCEPDYRTQNDAQIILNLSYADADNLKTTKDKHCLSTSPCQESAFTLGGTDIVGSMDIAKELLAEAKKINSGITNWRFIQPIVQNSLDSGLFCTKKPWSLRKIKRYLLKQVKNESIAVDASANDSQADKDVSDESSESTGSPKSSSALQDH